MTKTATTPKTALKHINVLADQLIFANEYVSIIFKSSKLNFCKTLSLQTRLGKPPKTHQRRPENNTAFKIQTRMEPEDET